MMESPQESFTHDQEDPAVAYKRITQEAFARVKAKNGIGTLADLIQVASQKRIRAVALGERVGQLEKDAGWKRRIEAMVGGLEATLKAAKAFTDITSVLPWDGDTAGATALIAWEQGRAEHYNRCADTWALAIARVAENSAGGYDGLGDEDGGTREAIWAEEKKPAHEIFAHCVNRAATK